MRAFVGIDLPKGIKQRIAELEEDFTKCDLAFKWVAPVNLHLTLKFLGNIDQGQISKIKQAITKTADGFSAVVVNFDSFGFFPDKRKPRIFFISTTGSELLKNIAAKLEEELETLGFEKEGRFKSHITLARIKNLKNIDCLRGKIENIPLDEKIPLDKITLYKSTLTEKGPIYENIFKINLTA